MEKKLTPCPVNVGTNTEVQRHDVTDEIEQSSLEPVKYRPAAVVSKGVVEQGVQYNEEDIILPDASPYQVGFPVYWVCVYFLKTTGVETLASV